MSVKPEYLAVDSLAAWLRMQLPAKVTELNAARAAVLRTPAAGSFTIPVGAVLKLSYSAKGAASSSVPLTSGVRSAAQLTTEVNSALGGSTASADTDGRFLLTSASAPVDGTPSVVSIAADSTGANAALGWDAGGEYVINTALVAPGHRAVMDGWPQQLDAGKSFIVVIGKRSSILDKTDGSRHGVRSDQHIVTLELAIFRPAVQQENHRSREHIHACVQAVREVLKTDRGMQLGRSQPGDIVAVEVGKCAVEGMRFQPMKAGQPFGPAFDSASLTVYVRVFERPAAS